MSDSSSSISYPIYLFRHSASWVSFLDEAEELNRTHPRLTCCQTTTASSLLQEPKGCFGEHLGTAATGIEMITNPFRMNLKSPADTKINTAALNYRKRNYKVAVRQYRRGLATLENVHGKDHIYTTDVLIGLAWALYRLGLYGDAMELNKKVLRINESHFGIDHFCTADAIMNIGLCHQYEGRHTEAMEAYKRALRIKESVLWEGHVDTVEIMATIGLLYYLLGMDDTALQQYEGG